MPFTCLPFRAMLAAAVALTVSGAQAGIDDPAYDHVSVHPGQEGRYLLELPAGRTGAHTTAFEIGDTLNEAARHVCPLGYMQTRVFEASTRGAPDHAVMWEVKCMLGISVYGVHF